MEHFGATAIPGVNVRHLGNVVLTIHVCTIQVLAAHAIATHMEEVRRMGGGQGGVSSARPRGKLR